jgi:hypothetical protein
MLLLMVVCTSLFGVSVAISVYAVYLTIVIPYIQIGNILLAARYQ